MIEIREIKNPKEIKGDAWTNFMKSVDFESNQSNFKYEFKDMTKRYGQAYIEYCRAAWIANDDILTEKEFRQINGDIPEGFFNNIIKKNV
jgi:hypothetical protein